jgi:hypothetical protein
VNRRDLVAILLLGILESEARDARGSLLRNDFDAFDDTGNDDVLDARVEVFGVFANNDQVDVRIARDDVWNRAARGAGCVKVERLRKPTLTM